MLTTLGGSLNEVIGTSPGQWPLELTLSNCWLTIWYLLLDAIAFTLPFTVKHIST